MRSLFGSDEDLDEILADDNNDDNADNDGDIPGSNDDSDDTDDAMGNDGNAVKNNDDGDGDGHGDAANADDDTIDGDDVNGADDELAMDSHPQVSQPLFSSLDPSMSRANPPESSDFGPIRTPRRTFSRRQLAPMPEPLMALDCR